VPFTFNQALPRPQSCSSPTRQGSNTSPAQRTRVVIIRRKFTRRGCRGGRLFGRPCIQAWIGRKGRTPGSAGNVNGSASDNLPEKHFRPTGKSSGRIMTGTAARRPTSSTKLQAETSPRIPNPNMPGCVRRTDEDERGLSLGCREAEAHCERRDRGANPERASPLWSATPSSRKSSSRRTSARPGL